MKKTIFTLCAAGAVIGAQAQTLTVKIDGWGNESIHCIKRVMGGESSNDTITAQNGVVTITNDGTLPMSVTLLPAKCIVVTTSEVSGMKSTNTNYPVKTIVSAVILNDKSTEIVGKFDFKNPVTYTVSGNDFAVENAKFIEVLGRPVALQLETLMPQFEKATGKEQEKIMEQLQQIMANYTSAVEKYVTDNPDSDVSAYYVTDITDKEVLQKLVDTLTPRARNGAFKVAIDKQVETYITNNGWQMSQ